MSWKIHKILSGFSVVAASLLIQPPSAQAKKVWWAPGMYGAPDIIGSSGCAVAHASAIQAWGNELCSHGCSDDNGGMKDTNTSNGYVCVPGDFKRSAGGSRNAWGHPRCDAGETMVDGECVQVDRTPPDGPAPPICPVGNPVDPLSGAKIERYVDFSVDDADGMKLERIYNSELAAQSGNLQQTQIGYGWKTNFDVLTRPIYDGCSGNNCERTLVRLYVIFPDGNQIVFKRDSDGSMVHAYFNNGFDSETQSSKVWSKYEGKSKYALVKNGINYELSGEGQKTFVFDDNIKLTQIKYLNGYTQELKYNSNNKLYQVTDNRGRSLDFHVNPYGMLKSVDTPAGTIIATLTN